MLTFLFKNLLIFTQNFSLSNVEKKFFLSSLFLKKIYQIFKIWKKFMHKNAIKIVGGVKFSKKIPQNVGFFDQKVWDFWHWGGDKIVGFSASRGGFSPFNFWPHCVNIIFVFVLFAIFQFWRLNFDPDPLVDLPSNDQF